jgi:signal transduction histidine kinase
LIWLSETDSGALRLKVEPHSIGQLITTEVERWYFQAQVANIELELLPLSSDLPPIQMDAVRMNQALGNLIEYALQHTSTGGRVTVQCSIDGNSVETAVCDTGSGIAAEHLPYVFDRFYRADSSRSRETGGSGLGLAISQAFVQAHGGRVTAESEGLGHGTTVHFELKRIA